MLTLAKGPSKFLEFLDLFGLLLNGVFIPLGSSFLWFVILEGELEKTIGGSKLTVLLEATRPLSLVTDLREEFISSTAEEDCLCGTRTGPFATAE